MSRTMRMIIGFGLLGIVITLALVAVVIALRQSTEDLAVVLLGGFLGGLLAVGVFALVWARWGPE